MKATIEKQKSKGGRPRIELTDAQLAELKIKCRRLSAF